MPTIDFDSIIKKASKYMGSSEMNDRVSKTIDEYVLNKKPIRGKNAKKEIEKYHSPEEIAKKFADYLLNVISREEGLSKHARDVLSAEENIGITEPRKKSKGKYSINVFFKEEYMHRDSLAPKKFKEGIDDIVVLLNDGVDHPMRPVFGVWHKTSSNGSGEDIETWSRTVIKGAHFLEDARDRFFEKHKDKYGIKDIKLNK